MVVTQPKFVLRCSESSFVMLPVSIKLYRAVKSPLENSPTATISHLIAKYLNGLVVWIDDIHPTCVEALFFERDAIHGWLDMLTITEVFSKQSFIFLATTPPTIYVFQTTDSNRLLCRH